MLTMAIKTTEIVQMISAGLALAAAIASWLSVRLSYKAFRTGLRPQLDGYWDFDDVRGVLLVVHNTGGGIAREPYCYAVAGEQKFSKRIVKTGPLRPGEHASILLKGVSATDHSDDIANVLCCQDWSRKWHVWARDGRHGLIRTKLWKSPLGVDAADAFHRMYPKISTAGLQEGDSPRV